jgi:hypothetical protein
MNTKPNPVVGRLECQAISIATGIKRIRAIHVNSSFDDVTEWTVRFLPTDEQVRDYGLALAEFYRAAPSEPESGGVLIS